MPVIRGTEMPGGGAGWRQGKSCLSAQSRHEEFERVLRGMRDRLVAVSDEISRTLTKANWHAETVPAQIRVPVQAAIADITSTQNWLQARLGQLPVDQQQRYQAMHEMLQVQFVALQKVTSIVDELLALRDRPAQPEYLPPAQRPQPMLPLAPPQAQVPFARDFGAPPAGGAHAPRVLQQPQRGAPQHAYAPMQGRAAPVRLADLDGQTMQPAPPPQARPPAAERTKGKSKGKGKSEKAGASSMRLGMVAGALVGTIIVLGIVGYVAFTRMSGTQTAGSRTQRVAIGDPAARQATNNGVSGTAPVRSVDGAAVRVPQAPPMSSPPLADRQGAQDNGFVSVIATHRDKDALAAMYADLRKQYPTIIGVREAEAQSINLGAQGVWHHLVLMPPLSRPQAEATCEELKRAGNARCAVRSYRMPQ